MLSFIILLQKESLFSFISVLIYNVSCELLRLHMQFSHNSNNVLENHKLTYNANSTDIWRKLLRILYFNKLMMILLRLFSRHYSSGLLSKVTWSPSGEITSKKISTGRWIKCYFPVWNKQKQILTKITKIAKLLANFLSFTFNLTYTNWIQFSTINRTVILTQRV